MKFKDFVRWCNERARDGCWGMREAAICIAVHDEVRKEWFWRRGAKWRELNTKYGIESDIIIPINDMIAEVIREVERKR